MQLVANEPWVNLLLRQAAQRSLIARREVHATTTWDSPSSINAFPTKTHYTEHQAVIISVCESSRVIGQSDETTTHGILCFVC
jgi:hypothetical protein